MNASNPIKCPLQGSLLMIIIIIIIMIVMIIIVIIIIMIIITRPRSDPPKMKNSTPDKIVAEKKTKRIGW